MNPNTNVATSQLLVVQIRYQKALVLKPESTISSDICVSFEFVQRCFSCYPIRNVIATSFVNLKKPFHLHDWTT